MKEPGTSDSHDYPIPSEKQAYIVLKLKDTFFNLTLAEVNQPIFAFKWAEITVGDLHGPGRPKDLKTQQSC